MNSYSRKSTVLVLLMMFFIPALASAGEVNTGYFGNVAIKGYDPVAYFTEQKAMKGSEGISYTWLGADWNFTNQQHKNLFAENPVKYAPQYGGHCADGVAYGETTVNIDPLAWNIIDGKLYINSGPGAAAELEEVDGQVAKAEKKWPEIRAGLLANSD
jgi:YHS domain-containing protein